MQGAATGLDLLARVSTGAEREPADAACAPSAGATALPEALGQEGCNAALALRMLQTLPFAEVSFPPSCIHEAVHPKRRCSVTSVPTCHLLLLAMLASSSCPPSSPFPHLLTRHTV